jgi:hypothetical protein
MLFTEIIAVYTENHTKPTNALCGKNAYLLIAYYVVGAGVAQSV